jgi:hypothetical protein
MVMVTKKHFQIRSIILLLIILFSSSCDKINIRKCEREFLFTMPINIYPAKNTYSVGDTFYIEINTPTKMYNKIENNYIEVKDFCCLSSFLRLYKITKADSNKVIDIYSPGYDGSLTTYSFNCLNSITNKGSLATNGLSTVLKFDVDNSSFVHKTAIIVLDTGLFHIDFTDAFFYHGSSRGLKLIESDCLQNWLPIEFTVDSGNCNISLLNKMGITVRKSDGLVEDIEQHNFEHGSWSFNVVP